MQKKLSPEEIAKAERSAQKLQEEGIDL